MSNVTLKHIYKMYPNGAKAVNDFNMEIEDGEFIVFVGPSGCGKSTTLRMIAGLEQITAGELTIGGVVANDVPPQNRNIAMVFQNYALYPHMNVYDNMAFGLEMHKVPKDEIERRVNEAARILDITEYLKRKPKEMSGGQRQRVALGRAIVRNPQVMLLDEPLSNLDAKLRTQMRSEIAKLHSELKTTFIYVTHDQVEAMTMGTRIVVMKEGYVQQIDTPTNLYRYPSNKFVAGFIGTPQMNFLHATLKRTGDEVLINLVNCGASITAPYEYFYKVHPKYFDGQTSVIVGFRSEDIYIPTEPTKDTAMVQVKGYQKEELGSEALVHGYIMSSDGEIKDGSQIILKIKSEEEPTDYVDKVFTAAFNLHRIHIFDSETEESVMPRIPKYNTVECSVEGNAVQFLGEMLNLPSALKKAECANEILIPSDAFRVGGNILFEIKKKETVDNKNLYEMELAERRLYAVLNEDLTEQRQVGMSIDPKRITFRKDGEEIISPLPQTVCFDALLKKGKKQRISEENCKNFFVKIGYAIRNFFGPRKYDYLLGVGDLDIPAPENLIEKLTGAITIRDALKSTYSLECSPYDISIGEQGVSAEVLQIRDYGEERFAECRVGENSVFVCLQQGEEPTGIVKISIDIDKFSVVQKEKDIRII